MVCSKTQLAGSALLWENTILLISDCLSLSKDLPLSVKNLCVQHILHKIPSHWNPILMLIPDFFHVLSKKVRRQWCVK